METKKLTCCDLMIGDWVECNGKFIQVENVHKDMINYTPDIPYVQEEYFIEGMVNTDFGRGSLDTLNKVLNFINSLPAEQPSEELEKEIKSYFNNGWQIHESLLPMFYNIARHFADWQKEQMMKSAIDAKIVNDESSGCVVDCEQGCLVLEPHTYPIGQKLKILILEDEQ